ncbi:hypothetical protein [Aureimonas glaciei]|uniref:Uncharacterized protein n=1 Tax=Aureimonas glaciei TaxID=1776957 RepID=A0A916XXN8_9HYPH|nr:hypothetical protein [Aureimonas glaciei]GGD19841.1 hypothetical protein GCM10011335_23440 [Aureimonas glaciei]
MEFTQVIDEDGDPVCVYCDGHVDLREHGRSCALAVASFVSEMAKDRETDLGETFAVASATLLGRHLPEGIKVEHFWMCDLRGDPEWEGDEDYFLDICPADAAGAFPVTGAIFAK